MQKKEKWKMKPGMKLFWAALPFIVIYFLFSYLPLDGWRYAFYNYKPGYKLSDCEYVGFKHFTNMFAFSFHLKKTNNLEIKDNVL